MPIDISKLDPEKLAAGVAKAKAEQAQCEHAASVLRDAADEQDREAIRLGSRAVFLQQHLDQVVDPDPSLNHEKEG